MYPADSCNPRVQAYLRFAAVPHALAPSTNHASPTGSLPFLQPALPSSPEHRLDPRLLLPIPSSRLDSYARQHGSAPSHPAASPSSSDTTTTTTPDQRHRRQQAYQSLLDHPIRNAWLYALYLAPANEPLLRNLYVDRVSRAALVRATTLHQLRAAARAEIAKAGPAAVTADRAWSLSGNVGDLLTWALGGRATIDADKIYDDARRALGALETLLGAATTTERGGEEEQGEDERADEQRGQPSSRWFFDAARPTLFDAAVFSYTHLILSDDYSSQPWGDDTLRRIVRDGCPLLVAHARAIRERYW